MYGPIVLHHMDRLHTGVDLMYLLVEVHQGFHPDFTTL
jgi:hypothetical protein